MTQEQLDVMLKQLSAKPDKDGWVMPEGSLLTIQVAHDGANLAVTRIDSLRVEAGIVTARSRREVHCFAVGDAFALSSDGGGVEKGRRPGFG